MILWCLKDRNRLRCVLGKIKLTLLGKKSLTPITQGILAWMKRGQDKVQLQDPPASFQSAAWKHYRLSVTYDSDRKKVADKTVCVQALGNKCGLN